jgi:predicted dehydrogenase
MQFGAKIKFCDVDEKNLKRAADLCPGARTYTDYRELLKAEQDNIDSVNVTVPDHNHYAIAVQAIRNKKHVYCQKPMCHDVAEVRALTKEAVKAGVTTQLGTQIASMMGDRTGVIMIKQGLIGKVKHAYLCSNRPGAAGDHRNCHAADGHQTHQGRHQNRAKHRRLDHASIP